jgi:hypothetical protein
MMVKDLYEFVEIEHSDLANLSDALEEISRRKYDGLIIRNVFSQEEVGLLKSGVSNVPLEYIVETPDGCTIPGTYTIAYEHWDNPDPDAMHFSRSSEFWQRFSEFFGVDYNKRVQDVFRTTGGGRTVEVPMAYGESRYPEHTIRILFPYRGGIQMHCENYLFSLFKETSADLRKQLDYSNGLSYWVLINKPEAGGELVVYDLEWDKVKDDLDNVVTVNKEGKFDLVNRDSTNYMNIQVNEGDMVIFAAGQIWHKIAKIRGLTSRVTIGGFMGFSAENKSVFHWS